VEEVKVIFEVDNENPPVFSEKNWWIK